MLECPDLLRHITLVERVAYGKTLVQVLALSPAFGEMQRLPRLDTQYC